MAELYIKKTIDGYFEFTLNGDSANTIANTRNDLTAIGTQLHFKTSNGANLIQKQEIYPEDVTLEYSSTILTFTTVTGVFNGLKDAGFFDWVTGTGSGGSGVDKFEDLLDTFDYSGNNGKTVKVNETLQRLDPVEYRLTKKFTDLDDVPDTLIADKMVVINSTGTGLIFQDTPTEPEQFLNSVGWFMYNDLATQTTPISFVTNVDKKLTNDANGAGTSSTYAPFGISRVWDTDLNQLDLSQLSLGDIINMRLLIETTTTSANQVYTIKLKSAIGSPIESNTVIQTDSVKSAGTKTQAFSIQAVISSDNIKNFPSEFYINSDGNGTIKIKGFLFSVIRRDVNIIQLGNEGLDLKEDKINKISAITGTSTLKYTSEKAVKDYVDAHVSSIPDASNLVKGIIKLAGDLGGTADLPTVPGLAAKEILANKIDTISGSSSINYTSEKAVKDYVDGKVSSVYKYKGSVANFASLPSSGQITGDVWNTEDTGMNYGWTGTTWDSLGATTIDVSGKEDIANKTDDIEANKTSSAKYSSTKGVVDWIKNFFISNLSTKSTLVNADSVIIGDSADSNKTKIISWSNVLITIQNWLFGKFDSTDQIEISSSQNVQMSWNGKVILFTSNCTITVPATVDPNFSFQGVALAGVTITWAITTPKTWLFSTPSSTIEKTTFSLMQRGSTNSIILLQ